MLNFELATAEEVCKQLGQRLKQQRLSQNICQADLAARAGVSTGTIKNLERKGQCSLDTLAHIVMALGLGTDLEALFQLKVHSIAQMEQAATAVRPRASRRKRA